MVSASCSMAPDSRRSESCGRLSLVAAGLDRAVQLRQRDHRHAHLFGELLEPARNLADLLLAAVHAGAAPHQLQVVDDHETDACARRAVGAPGDRTRPAGGASWRAARGAERRRVVDPDGQAVEKRRRFGEVVPVVGLASSPGGSCPRRRAPREQTMRLASCSRGISSENTATPNPGSSRASPTLTSSARWRRRRQSCAARRRSPRG